VTGAFTGSSSRLFYRPGNNRPHLLVGALALILCLSVLGWLKRVEYRQIAVDATAWYWHAMGLAWLLLMAVLALGQ
jgi:cytochrome c oxidase subunit 3